MSTRGQNIILDKNGRNQVNLYFVYLVGYLRDIFDWV